MFFILNLHNAVSQLYLNKAGGKDHAGFSGGVATSQRGESGGERPVRKPLQDSGRERPLRMRGGSRGVENCPVSRTPRWKTSQLMGLRQDVRKGEQSHKTSTCIPRERRHERHTEFERQQKKRLQDIQDVVFSGFLEICG